MSDLSCNDNVVQNNFTLPSPPEYCCAYANATYLGQQSQITQYVGYLCMPYTVMAGSDGLNISVGGNNSYPYVMGYCAGAAYLGTAIIAIFISLFSLIWIDDDL